MKIQSHLRCRITAPGITGKYTVLTSFTADKQTVNESVFINLGRVGEKLEEYVKPSQVSGFYRTDIFSVESCQKIVRINGDVMSFLRCTSESNQSKGIQCVSRGIACESLVLLRDLTSIGRTKHHSRVFSL